MTGAYIVQHVFPWRLKYISLLALFLGRQSGCIHVLR